MADLIYGKVAPGAMGNSTKLKIILNQAEDFICRRHIFIRLIIMYCVFAAIINMISSLLVFDFLKKQAFVLSGLIALVCAFFPRLAFMPLHLLASSNYKAAETIHLRKEYIKPLEFNLRIGYSTGLLAINRDHNRGLAPHQHVHLSLQDAATNIMVLGGTGAGKTTEVINPLLNQLLAQDTGGLIFDIKGSYKNTVYALANQNHRAIKTIGIGKTPMNLLKGLSPETVSGFLISAFYLGGKVNDGFWISASTNLCKSILYVLQQCSGEYTLKALYQFVKFPEYRKTFIKTAMDKLPDLSGHDRELLMTALQECDAFFKMDGKLKDSVIITIEQVLNSFTHPDIENTFCRDVEGAADMQDVVNGTIFLLDLPLAEWRKTGKTIYTFVKLRFMDVMQSREWTPDMNQDRPVFFCCDEFQDIVAGATEGLSDLDFWSKSRSAKTIGLISSQSLTALRKACGDSETSDTIFSNFRQKIFLRTEDKLTLEFMNFLGGEREVERISHSEGTTNGGGLLGNNSSNQGQTTNLTMRPVVDVSLVKDLEPGQVVAFLNINRRAADDVISMEPIYV